MIGARVIPKPHGPVQGALSSALHQIPHNAIMTSCTKWVDMPSKYSKVSGIYSTKPNYPKAEPAFLSRFSNS